MEEDRFPTTCLEKLTKLDRSPPNNRKYNWDTKLREELEAINGKEILQLSREEILDKIQYIGNKMEIKIYLEDRKRELKSRY